MFYVQFHFSLSFNNLTFDKMVVYKLRLMSHNRPTVKAGVVLIVLKKRLHILFLNTLNHEGWWIIVSVEHLSHSSIKADHKAP